MRRKKKISLSKTFFRAVRIPQIPILFYFAPVGDLKINRSTLLRSDSRFRGRQSASPQPSSTPCYWGSLLLRANEFIQDKASGKKLARKEQNQLPPK